MKKHNLSHTVKEEMAKTSPFFLPSMKEGLIKEKNVLKNFNNPQDRLKTIHVAGTNGKGSTCLYLSNILKEAGLKMGLFTSPYLNSKCEQIKINSVDISLTNFDFQFNKVLEMTDKLKISLSEFEMTTIAAFNFFFEEKCDIVIVETGLGGRYDATNVIKSPLISIITNISYEHTDVLGNTLTEIANQKAGIIKENGTVITIEQEREIISCIEKEASLKNATLYITKELKDFNKKEMPSYQLKNLSLVLKACTILNALGYKISNKNIEKGINNTKNFGRFQIIEKNPRFILDGAHNSAGSFELVSSLKKITDKKVIFIVGVFKDKDVLSIVKNISTIAKKVFTITPENERGLRADSLAEIFLENNVSAIPCKNIEEACLLAKSEVEFDEVICACGSLSFLGNFL